MRACFNTGRFSTAKVAFDNFPIRSTERSPFRTGGNAQPAVDAQLLVHVHNAVISPGNGSIGTGF